MEWWVLIFIGMRCLFKNAAFKSDFKSMVFLFVFMLVIVSMDFLNFKFKGFGFFKMGCEKFFKIIFFWVKFGMINFKL